MGIADREKVIKGLEVCTSKPCYCIDCPYKANCCLDSQEVMEDALALLKELEEQIDTQRKNLMILLNEQEAIEPLFNKQMKHFVCPNCSLVLY